MKTNVLYYSNPKQSDLQVSLVRRSNIYNDFLPNLYLIIEDNIDDSLLTVGFIAKRMAVSRSTLNRRLSILVGLSANEIIKQHRLQKATTLLISGKNVSETAYLTGFETPSYFIQCFKEFYKVTPKVYSEESKSLFDLNKGNKNPLL
jgi:AraC-like DNA-binding protein